MLTAEERDQIFKTAKEKNGDAVQILKAVEELNECAAKLAKYLAGEIKHMDEVYTELADAEIMLEQMRYYFNPEYIDEEKEYKLTRLSKILLTKKACAQPT